MLPESKLVLAPPCLRKVPSVMELTVTSEGSKDRFNCTPATALFGLTVTLTVKSLPGLTVLLDTATDTCACPAAEAALGAVKQARIIQQKIPTGTRCLLTNTARFLPYPALTNHNPDAHTNRTVSIGGALTHSTGRLPLCSMVFWYRFVVDPGLERDNLDEAGRH